MEDTLPTSILWQGQNVRQYEIKKGWNIKYQVLGGANAAGMCGSAVIDAVNGLRKKNLIDENGTLCEPWFSEGFPIAGEKIRLTQNDIREVQMGKAAIRAGIELLCNAAVNDMLPGIQKEKKEGADISTIYLAGGFGYALDVYSAVGIGMLPAEFAEKIKVIGNSSLEGTKRFLCEPEAAGEMEWIASHAKECNLAMQAQFSECYISYMLL